MDIRFRPLAVSDAAASMAIFNHYVENGFAAFPDTRIPEQACPVFLKESEGYPALGCETENGELAGFGLLKPYKPFSTLKHVAEVACFLRPGETGRGLGGRLYAELFSAGRARGVERVLAAVTSANEGSLRFHRRMGFEECGRFSGVLRKKGRELDLIWLLRVL